LRQKISGARYLFGMNKHSTAQFIEKARAIHGKRYDYSQVEYDRSHNQVSIVCQRHGVFLQAPFYHLQGHGCAYCGSGGQEVFEAIQRLNKEHGWNLVGGNQEFAIPTGLTAAGKYKFDGADLQRLIFFEHNGKLHRDPAHKATDTRKKLRLKEWLAERGLAGKATYVVYDVPTEALTQEAI
jgi:hypothetical protein